MNLLFRIAGSSLFLSLTACNLFGFMDTPKGDLQLLDAARACLDQGDFVCAKEYYQSLSNNLLDVKTSESSLVAFGEANIFFISDLITSLGSGAGGGNSIVILAELMNSRGKTDGPTRSLIQTRYLAENSISESTLKAYSQMLSSLTMISSLLGTAVGADGKLTPSDLVRAPTACRSADCSTLVTTDCDRPASSAFLDTATSEVTDMSTSTHWTSESSIKKLSEAARSADQAITVLTGSASAGLFTALDLLGELPNTIGDKCRRQTVLKTLFPE